MKEKWFIKNSRGNFDQIGYMHHIDPVIAQLIVNRGIYGNEEMEKYLHPSLSNLHSPFLLKDLEKAGDILQKKIKEGKTIRIIGDYDVDGVMSTYLLLTGLKNCGANVDYEIPDRIKDGYGINIEIIKACINEGIDTIVTCDNGIAAKEQIKFARENGLTVIITDHHDIPLAGGIPEADAVVNPKQEDCSYPFKDICGAVVSLKLVEALYIKCLSTREKVYELLEFAAIATVCDVMDLKDENRIIVYQGIRCIQKTKNIGLKALMEECGLLGKPINAYHFGFIIGPCINASGRLESAKLSLKLLLSKEEETAKQLASKLRSLNEERKNMTAHGLEDAVEVIENSELKQDKVLLVYLADCHESLAGIIAGRLRERYNKPAIVLTRAEEGLKGSGRSIEEYHMFAELSKCSELLTKFGGHPMAAGLSLEEKNMEKLRKKLNENTSLTEEDLARKVSFDMVLPLERISINLIHQLDCLEPYGKGNIKPLFVRKEVIITEARILGANKNVIKLQIKEEASSKIYTAMLFQNHLAFMEAIAIKYAEGIFEKLLKRETEVKMDFVFSLQMNEYNGMETPQLIIQNFR